MPRHRLPYPAEFRRQMVELVRSGRTPEELSREFEPTAQAIWNWVRQADREGGVRRDDGLPSAEREELGRLIRAGDRHDPVRVFQFMSAHQAIFPIAAMARVLGVSRAGYYAWLEREPSARARANEALLKRIRTAHAISRGTYGAPRIHAELKADKELVGRKRVARMMREAALAGVSRRRGPVTTRRDREARPAPDLVDRNFTADAPNRPWVANITFVPTLTGFLYLAVVLDAWSRRIVGWAMANHLRTELVLDAFEMALGQRRPTNVVHHSDQGSQYTSLAFGGRCREAGVRPSMGSVGDAYDNAMCESFFATLECELLARRRFASHARPGWRSSATSKAGTTRADGTRP